MTTQLTHRDIPSRLTLAEYVVSYSDELAAASNRLARSMLMPDTLRVTSKDAPEERERKVRDVAVLLARCLSTGEDILSLGASIYIVGGRAALAADYVVARAQQVGAIHDAPTYRQVGTWPDFGVEARVKSAAGAEHAVTVWMQEAREDGWASRNPKYRAEKPALNMLRHRAAARLIAEVAPGVRLGMAIREEVEDQPYRPGSIPVTVDMIPEATAPVGPDAPAIEQDADLLADIEAEALAQRQPEAVPVEREPASVPPVAKAVVVPLSRDDLKAKIARAETALGQQIVWPIRTRMEIPLEKSVAALSHSFTVLEEYMAALQGALDARAAALDADDAT